MKKHFHKILIFGLLACACTGTPKQQENKEENPVKTEQVKEEQHGTVFHDLTLGDAIEKAKLEGKSVFIDCYTQSCGPCKRMVKEIFPGKACGEYLNSNFICIKKDMEQNVEDVNYLNEKYDPAIFPTFLIIKSDSTLLCALNGAILDEGRFIETLKSTIAEAEAKLK